MSGSEARIRKALEAKRESKHLEFKGGFDPASPADWCALVKGVVALANSGGGVLLYGVGKKGQPTGEDVQPLLSLDPAAISDKIRHYTGCDFSGFELVEQSKASKAIGGILVEEVLIPMVFINPGTYPVDGGKRQDRAFSQGTVYFRHGAKSEPGTTEDLRTAFERRLAETRREWLAGVRTVVRAPHGSRIIAAPAVGHVSPSGDGSPVRISVDPGAPTFGLLSPDDAFPYRGKELLAEINRGLPAASKVNSYDLQAIRKVHNTDDRPEFSHLPKFGSRQYSRAFVDWILQQHSDDKAFFETTRRSLRAART